MSETYSYSFGNDNAGTTGVTHYGVYFQVTLEQITSITIECSTSQTTTKAYLFERTSTGNGTLLSTKTFSSYQVTFDYNFEINKYYYIVFGSDGSSSVKRANSSLNFPLSIGGIINIVGTASNTYPATTFSEGTTYFWGLKTMTITRIFNGTTTNGTATSGTKYIKNSYPTLDMTPRNLIPEKSILTIREEVGL